jgi:hypothetical protein
VTIATATRATIVSRPSCSRWGQLVVDDAQDDGDRHAQRDGQADAEPHRAQGVGPPLALEEGGDDAHDERGLEALAKGDHERRQHGILRVGG